MNDKDAIANIAKPPGFSTSNAPPEQYNSVNSDPKKEIPDHSGLPCGRIEQAASAQARKKPSDKKGPGGECAPGYTSSHVSNSIRPR